ncbi:MAG: hypothetical protein R3E96_02455 [Planctomycetota bacterium]
MTCRAPCLQVAVIASGQTWHFQLWYRDGVANSNFSNGLSITF